MKRRTIISTVASLALLGLYIQPLYAYLDPGTGSMLLAALVGILSTLLFTMQSLWYKLILYLSAKIDFIKMAFRKRTKGSLTEDRAFKSASRNIALYKEAPNIVFYSEGSQYWNTFSPIIETLHNRQVHVHYLSSDEQDPGLSVNSPYVLSKHIGKGNKAYANLNFLRAKVCVLTTPNLDTLQIRRSRGVSHYAHIVHAPTDIHLYKLYAFDFYDSILISGPHQEKSIRYLETIRATACKQLYKIGCPYMDVLLQKKIQTSTQNSGKNTTTPTILVAPTWGESSLLRQYGKNLLQPLLDTDYTVIVRPHPQSFVVEPYLIEELQEHFRNYKNLHWDAKPDNFLSLSKADLLISDRSGIIFDFAFIFKKPIIYNTSKTVLLGMEGMDIPWDAWELEILPNIATSINADSLQNISQLADTIITRHQKNPQEHEIQINSVQEQYLYNLSCTGEHAADALTQILDAVQSQETSTT